MAESSVWLSVFLEFWIKECHSYYKFFPSYETLGDIWPSNQFPWREILCLLFRNIQGDKTNRLIDIRPKMNAYSFLLQCLLNSFTAQRSLVSTSKVTFQFTKETFYHSLRASSSKVYFKYCTLKVKEPLPICLFS